MADFKSMAKKWGGYSPSVWDRADSGGYSDNWQWMNRVAFNQGNFLIRPVSHPLLNPQGAHPYVKHDVPLVMGGQPSPILCTSSFAPDQDCYICDLLIDLDEEGWFQGEGENDRKLSSALQDLSAPAKGFILIPCLVYGRAGKSIGKDGKEWPALESDKNGTISITLALAMKRDSDMRFFSYLQELKEADQTLDDIRFGKWLVYEKGAKSQKLTIATSQYQRPLTKEEIELCSDKLYPKITKYGCSETNAEKNFVYAYYQQKTMVEGSWIGQALINQYGWDLNVPKKSAEYRNAE